jgi:hypothetical protein
VTVDRIDPQEIDLEEIARLLGDPEALKAALPVEEREEYERCRRSVVEARRTAEREGWRYVV